jgi:Flp pilus assembly protein TadG
MGMPLRMLRTFFGDDRGSVAVEMAIVGPLFILLMLTIVEMTLTLVTQSALDGATRDAVRLLRSGQLAAGGINQQAALFQRVLCDNLSPLVSQATCATNVVFDVEPVSSFGGVAFQHDPPCTQSASSSGSGVPCAFNLGSGGQIVGVQVRYWRPFIVPWVGQCLSGSCWTGRGSAQGSSPGISVMLQTSVAIFRY